MQYNFTPTGFEKLTAEIARLDGGVRDIQGASAEIAELGGDLWHDNAGLDSLVIQLRGADKRLAIIQDVRNNSRVVTVDPEPKRVGIGTVVTFEKDGHSDKIGIVGFGQSDPEKNLMAYDTPLAKVLLGLVCGQTHTAVLNKEKTTVKIVSIEPLQPQMEMEGVA